MKGNPKKGIPFNAVVEILDEALDRLQKLAEQKAIEERQSRKAKR